MGVNLFKQCEVILTDIPKNINDLHQMVGRSNRVDYTAPKFTCLIAKTSGFTQEGIVEGLEKSYMQIKHHKLKKWTLNEEECVRRTTVL